MRFNKTEKLIFIGIEIAKAEDYIINNTHCSPEMKDYYNHRIDMLLEIKNDLESKAR